MGNEVESGPVPVPRKRKTRWRWIWRMLPLVALAVLGYWWFLGSEEAAPAAATVGA